MGEAAKGHVSEDTFRMRTDRRQFDWLRDPDNTSVTLTTLRRAAQAAGRKLRVELA